MFSSHFKITEAKQDCRWPTEANNGTGGTLLGTNDGIGGNSVATSQLSTFCKAVYVKKQPLASQPKFLNALCTGAGAEWSYGDDYGRKLSNGTKHLTQDARDTFPATIDSPEVTTFLWKYLTDTTVAPKVLATRCSVVAANAGLSTTLNIDPDAFIPALADWFIAIIKNPEDCDILAAAYQRRLGGGSDPTPSSFTPLYAGDKVIVSKPPSQQDYSKPFWSEFSHEWVLQNLGTINWTGRSLVCTNPKDNGVRPDSTRIPVPDTPPSEFARVNCDFETRGREGKATSQWTLTDDNDQNCFPNHGTSLEVVVNVVNTGAPKLEVK